VLRALGQHYSEARYGKVVRKAPSCVAISEQQRDGTRRDDESLVCGRLTRLVCMRGSIVSSRELDRLRINVDGVLCIWEYRRVRNKTE
jgi:hypothetical protein